jgi:hypothetical protein
MRHCRIPASLTHLTGTVRRLGLRQENHNPPGVVGAGSMRPVTELAGRRLPRRATRLYVGASVASFAGE